MFNAGSGSETYYGDHPTVGALASVSSIADGAEATTTRVEIVILPKDDATAASLGSPLNQGVKVQWWEGVVNPNTGILSGTPLLKFEGEIDKPRLSVGASWAITLECGTQAERQLEPNSDWRLNHALQGKIWSDDTGLINVTNTPRKIYWRQAAPNGSISN
jgi:hypothetical protein